MKIGVAGYFNPVYVESSLTSKSKLDLKSINDTATSVNVLVKSFLNAGHKVVVFTGDHDSETNSTLYGENLIVHIIGLKVKYRYLFFFLYLFRTTYRIKKCFLKECKDIDVLHAHWTYEFAYVSSLFAEKLPVFCTVRDWAPFIYTTMKGIKYKVLWFQKKVISKLVLKNSKIQFISNSFYTQQLILKSFPNYNTPILFNSIDDEHILKTRNQYPQQFKLISISPSLDDERKNIDRLILAFRDFRKLSPESKLLLVGNIDFNGALYLKWKNNGLLENVEFLGYINHDKLILYLDEVSCLIHPSLEETFGNILLEGMAMRIPVIGGEKSGAVPFVLKNGQCGCLCDITDVKSIVDAIYKVYKNKFYVNEIVDNATHVLLNEYSSSVVCQKHISLYKSFLN